MAKNMNFTASLRLNTKDFKKGVADVQRSIKSLQSSFLSLAGALGIGMSFNRLGSSLMDTATKLSVAESSLKNVSKGIGEYGESLVWLRKISNEYGQDMVSLMKSFAQFRAAAATTNLTLEQMRDIYESLTRAAGAYHLSADEANNVMLAVTQMLSKGKVASEELRRQLGNSLPGAFSLMAQAAYNAGVITENSTAALEKAMKDGKVMAEQVLPSFAKVLNDVTENADFNSLQSSINRLKNSWTEMVFSANFEQVYKGIIDGASSVVKYMTDSFWPKISGALAGIGTMIFSPKIKAGFASFKAGVKEMQAGSVAEFNKIYASAEKLDDKIHSMFQGKGDTRSFVTKRYAKSRNPNIKGSLSYLTTTPFNEENIKSVGVNLNEAKKAIYEYNDALLKLNQTSKQAGGKPLFSNKDANAIAAYNAELKGTIKEVYTAPAAFERFNKETNLMRVGLSKLGSVAKGVVRMIGSAIATIGFGAIIAGITYLIGKLIEARKEAKRIAGIADEMVATVNKAGGENNKTLIQLTRIKKALEDINNQNDPTKRAKLIDEANKALGRTGDNLLTIEDDIKNKVIPAIDDYIGKIKAAAKQQAILALVSEKTSKIIQLEAENQGYTEDTNYGKTQYYYKYNGNAMNGPNPVTITEGLTNKAQKLQDKIDKNNKEIDALNEGIDKILKMADENTLNAIYGGKDTVDGPGGPGNDDDIDSKKKVKTPQTVLDDYKTELKKLEEQYKAGALLAADYKKQVEQLNQKSFEELSSFGWDYAMAGIKNSADKQIAQQLKQLATAKLLEGLDDPQEIEEFDKALEEEADKAYQLWKDAWDRFIEYRKKNPKLESADTFGDYMYSKKKEKGQTYSEYDTHFINEELSNYENYVSELESYRDDLKDVIKDVTDPGSIKRLNELLDQTIKKLELAKLTVRDLKTKANIAQLEKDIIDLKKQGLDAVLSSFTTLSDGMDRMYRAIQSIQQINDETWKSEELEEFLTTLNAIVQVFEVMKTVITALKTVEEVYAKIKEKNAAKAIALNTAEAASEGAKATAAAGAAAAGAASSTAGIPIVGPVLAVAAVAAVVAAILAGMKKFATGGYVGGNSYSGDKQLARVNSGELILNPEQQRNLLAIANGKTNNGKGEVTFKIHGADLVGTLNNYNRLRK